MELNLAEILRHNAGYVPDRPAIVHGHRYISYADLHLRSARLGALLRSRGLGCHRERSDLRPFESGQDLMAQYMYNGPEYLEGLFGAFIARAAAFNVNYRYVHDELAYLLKDARPRAFQFHASFAPMLAEVLSEIRQPELLLQVADESDNDLLPGALDYEEALASVQADEPPLPPSPDDVYVLYTGGTTGMPKGVLWRQADIAIAGLGLIDRATRTEFESEAHRRETLRATPRRIMPCAPFMHGAAQWTALASVCEGNTVVLPTHVDRMDAADIWDTAARHRVAVLTIVGDAFARPLAEKIEGHPRDLSALRYIISGGAALQPSLKERLAKAVPGVRILDTVAASETGLQGQLQTSNTDAQQSTVFDRDKSTTALNEEKTAELEPGHRGLGWLARRGRMPLGYLRDEDKTNATFVVVDGVRLSVPGDRARLLADGRIELLGRESVTINSGGEKIFAEEVEAAIRRSNEVVDVVVCGRPDERWGSVVVALVCVRDPDPDASTRDRILEHVRPHLARYKLPKDIVFVESVQRSPSGKPDYRWAKERAAGAVSQDRPAVIEVGRAAPTTR